MLVLTSTDDIIIQSEPQNQDKNRISEKKFQNVGDFELNFPDASDYETKLSQRVRFVFKGFTKRQTLD